MTDRRKIPFLRTVDTGDLVKIFENCLEDHSEVARKLDGVQRVSALEINIFCLNSGKWYSEGSIKRENVLEMIAVISQGMTRGDIALIDYVYEKALKNGCGRIMEL